MSASGNDSGGPNSGGNVFGNINTGGGGFAIGPGSVASGAGAQTVGHGGSITNNTFVVQSPAPLPPLAATPCDVFISYKREDRAQVEPIVRLLRQLVIDTWIDDHLQAGEAFTDRINLQVESCRAHIVAWSTRSIQSTWVLAEGERGRQRGTLIPIFLEPCNPPAPFNVLHTPDFSGWTGAQTDAPWRAVLAVLAQKLARPGLPELAQLFHRKDGPAVRDWGTRYPEDPFVAKKLR